MVLNSILIYGLALLISCVLLFTLFFLLLPLLKIYILNKQLKGSTEILFKPVLGLISLLANPRKGGIKCLYNFMKEKPGTAAILSNLRSKSLILFCSPEYVRLVTQNEKQYKRRVANLVVKEMWMNQSLFLSPHWKRQRKMLGPYFHHERLRNYIEPVEGICQHVMADLLRKIELNRGTPLPLKTLDFASTITGETILKFFFSEDFRGRTLNGKPVPVEIQSLLNQLFEEGRAPLTQLKRKILGIHRLQTAREKYHMGRIESLRKLTLELMKEKREKLLQEQQKAQNSQNSETKDLLTVYIEEIEKQRKLGNLVGEDEKITEEEIIHQFLMLFFAGTDTTAHLVGMSLYCLAKNPESYERISKEISVFEQEETGGLNAEKLAKLNYLNCFLKEVLRLYTPVPFIFFRECVSDHTLGDVSISKGTIVGVNLIASLMNPKLFPEPEMFDPSRWLRENEVAKDAFAFMPFYAGPRNCIGQHLALIESKVILVNFIKRFKVTLNPKVQLNMVLKFLNGPLNDELVLVEKR